jgi:predicted DNA repair protein MutK
MLGGAYLCYEGVEKIWHSMLSRPKLAHGRVATEHARHAEADTATEAEKISGAIRTDFILSAEIIVITLGVVAGQTFGIQVAVLVTVALMMTVGVYGVVAGIVRLDDLGLALALRGSKGVRAIGRGILAAAPWLLRGLSVAGTAAMFLVGGGIIAHGVPAIHAITSSLGGHEPGHDAAWWGILASKLADGLVGILAGTLAVGFVAVGSRVMGRRREPSHL